MSYDFNAGSQYMYFVLCLIPHSHSMVPAERVQISLHGRSERPGSVSSCTIKKLVTSGEGGRESAAERLREEESEEFM